MANGETKMGRHSKEKEVQEWQELHPNGTKADCHKDTKISRQTIHKFWKKPKKSYFNISLESLESCF